MTRIASDADATRASELLDAMLPHGTRFVQGDANEQWTTTDNLLQRIEERGLRPAIEPVTT